MGMRDRAKHETVRTLTASHGLAGPRVKQVKSLEEAAGELSKIKKTMGGSPGALNPVTLTETNTKTGKKKSISVGPSRAYGPGAGTRRGR